MAWKKSSASLAALFDAVVPQALAYGGSLPPKPKKPAAACGSSPAARSAERP